MTIDTRTSLFARLWLLTERAITALERLQPAVQVLARWFVAGVFFRSGLTKLRDWDTTVALFMDEYHVPLLDPTVAAFLATGAELLLPALLVLGLGGRVAAVGLFVLNVVAVLSVPEMPDAAWQGHLFWGSGLAALTLWGPGRWSLDALLMPHLRTRVIGRHAGSAGGHAVVRPAT